MAADVKRAIADVSRHYPHLLRENTHDSGAEFCWRVAKLITERHPEDPWGVLSKRPPEGGGHVGRHYIAHDVIVQKSSGLQYDIIVSGGSGRPTNAALGNPIDPSKYRAHNKYVDPNEIQVDGGDNDDEDTPPVDPPANGCPRPEDHAELARLRGIINEVFDRHNAEAEVLELQRFYEAPEGLQRPHPGLSLEGAPDFTAIMAWFIDVYVRARLAGKSQEEAREEYRRQIRESKEWKSKH